MFLKRLEITGFKSFAGRTVLDFDKADQIAAIVGPNGSGKSNIADGIRWVLGEQSYKSLRSKKSEDVIFSGSSGKSRASLAKVSIVLDNTDGKAPIDFTEVQVSRCVYRDGSSEYLLAGKKARLLDVAELLAKSGFGQSTYSVIGQGMVDSMLFYGPGERKVLFDEAAGVRAYELKREQTLKKLEDTNANIVRIKDILSELNPRLQTLGKQAQKAKEKDATAAQLAEKQKVYFSTIWDRLSISEKEARGDLEKILSEEQKLEEEIKTLNIEFSQVLNEEKGSGRESGNLRLKITKLEAQKGKILQEIYTKKAKLELKFSESTLSKKQLEEKIAQIEAELTGLKDKNLENQKTQIVANVVENEKKIAELDKKIFATKAKINSLSAELSKFDFGTVSEKVSAILYLQNDFVIRIDTAKTLKEVKEAVVVGKQIAERLKELRKQVGDVKEGRISGMGDIQQEMDELMTEKEEFSEKLSDYRSKIWQLEFEIRKESNKRFDLEKELGRLSNIKPVEGEEKAAVETEIKEMEAKVQAIVREIEALREKIQRTSLDFGTQSKKLTEIKDNLSVKQSLLSDYSSEATNLKVELGRIETKKQDVREQIVREMGSEAVLADAKALTELDEEQAIMQIERLKSKLYAIGEIDPEVEGEYTEVSERVEFMSSQTEDLEKAKSDLEKLIGELDGKIKKQFEASFEAISKKFGHFFEMLFGGGMAKLEQVRTQDEETDEKTFGIEISALPPGKRVQSLSALSGGERTLTSLALLFAILSVNPSPFCVLDEVDAALDEANTKKFLKIIEELSGKTQFIFISHNRETMKTAGVIYGVTMDESHASKLLSIKLTNALDSVKK